MKKVVVIGSNSFSGKDFVSYLLEGGKYTVAGISRSVQQKILPQKNFSFRRFDLNHDFPKLTGFLDSFKPEYVINFAGLIEVASSWKYPDDYFTTNTIANVKLGNYLKNAKYLKRYVHISTPEVYGSCHNAGEDTTIRPSTPYAASKAAADLFFATLVRNYNFPMITIRSSNVYGPGQQLFRIIPRTIVYIRLGKKIALDGAGMAVKSYIHIRDISKGELLAMEKGKNGNIYHFSPGQGIAVRDLVRLICIKMGVKFESVTKTAPERLGQDKTYILDSSKARRQLGWKPAISLDEGIEQVIVWVNENWGIIKKQPLEYQHKM